MCVSVKTLTKINKNIQRFLLGEIIGTETFIHSKMMVSSSIGKAFNLIGLGHFAFALYYHFTVISPIDVKFRGYEFGGPFIYITILASVRKQNNFELWKFFSVKKILSVNFSQGRSSDLLCCGAGLRFLVIKFHSAVQRLSFRHIGISTRI